MASTPSQLEQELQLQAQERAAAAKASMGVKTSQRRMRGKVLLLSEEANVSVVCRHSDLPQVTQERAGGWDSLPRITGSPISTWAGTQTLQETLTLLLDAWPHHNVEAGLTAVRKLGRRAPGLNRPPTLRVLGRTPYHGRTWVLAGLTVEDQLYVRGKTARSLLTLLLAEYVDPKIQITKPTAAASTRNKAHWYVWRKTDTLRSVAKSQLGDAGQTTAIRGANPKITQWSTVTAGTRVRIPAVK